MGDAMFIATPVELPPQLASADDRDTLDFDHHARIGETPDGDRRACREILAEYFGAYFSHSRRVTGIGEEDGHRDHVLQGSACFLQRRFDVLEGLSRLRVEVTGERVAGRVSLPGVTGNPDDLASLGDHRWRECAGLLPR